MLEEGVRFEGVTKRFGSSTALSNVSFSIKRGAFFTILGPSGCGKTTLLRILAGFERPDSGKIFVEGKDVTSVSSNKRSINTVFQNYSLFPHLDIWENIAFGLRISRKPEREIKREVEKMLELIQMTDHAHKMPEHISGGQKQRVAIARALINRPKVLLLDEPLAALDLKLRQKMLIDLDLIHDEVGITFIFITHDQTEAMAVSDQIAVINRGKIEQIGTPVEVYEAPYNTFVAEFIGDTNFFDGHVIESFGSDYSTLAFYDFPNVVCYNDKKISVGDKAHLSVRPEKIHISLEQPLAAPKRNIMQGIVEDVIYKGDHTYFRVIVGGHKVAVIQQHSRIHLDDKPIGWKENVWISWNADDGFILAKAS